MVQKKQNETRPHLLLTNDDGIHAPGMNALWEALNEADFADISIVAPASERSGTATGITWDRPIYIQEVSWANGIDAWAVDGTPADCVKLGTRCLLKKQPDLVVSGINAGSNAGRNVLHSGTAGAVIEGLLRNIPGIALSCEDGNHPNFHVAKRYVAHLIDFVLNSPQPEGTFLNVNFPHSAQKEVRGFKLTKQGRGRWAEEPKLHKNHKEGASWWIGGKPEELDEDSDCDIALLKAGFVTAVPIHIHSLHDARYLSEHAENFEHHFNNKVVV